MARQRYISHVRVIFTRTGIRLARSRQAALSLSVGRELHRRDATRRAGDGRAAALE